LRHLQRAAANAELPKHTDGVAAVVICAHCDATPELIADGRAQLSIVRHELGCPTLLAQTRTLWADAVVGRAVGPTDIDAATAPGSQRL